MLRHYVSPTQDDKDLYLSLVDFAYNNDWQESIQTTHFMLNHDHHLLCCAPLYEKYLKHHGHKGDPIVTPGTCGAVCERA